jgi:hypothetical protein
MLLPRAAAVTILSEAMLGRRSILALGLILPR